MWRQTPGIHFPPRNASHGGQKKISLTLNLEIRSLAPRGGVYRSIHIHWAIATIFQNENRYRDSKGSSVVLRSRQPSVER